MTRIKKHLKKHLYRPSGAKIYLNPINVMKLAKVGLSLDRIRQEYLLKPDTFAEYCRRFPEVEMAYQEGVAQR
jgi:hypothetical protein